MKSKVLFVLFAAVLSGCAAQNNPQENQVQNNINEMNKKIDALAYQIQVIKRNYSTTSNASDGRIAQLESEVATIFASSALAYDEAERANKRIDNMSQSYTK